MVKGNRDLTAGNDKPGICLSGGGALGIAHVGVLQALEEKGIFPAVISGSSMGAIVGTLYAAGYSPADILELIHEDKLYRISKLMTFNPGFLKSGLSKHDSLKDLIRELIPHNSFELLKKKMHICVMNLNKSAWEIVDSGGGLDSWVAASASVPGFFEAFHNEGMFYVDGGVLNNFPAQCIRQKCRILIGVDVFPMQIPFSLTKPVDSIAFSLRAMLRQNSQEGRAMCDFLIEPRAVDEFNEFRFDAYHEIFRFGYDAAARYMKENPGIMKPGY